MNMSSPSDFHERRRPERGSPDIRAGCSGETLPVSFLLVLLVFILFLGVIPLLLLRFPVDLQAGAFPEVLTVFLQVYPMHLALLCAVVLPVWSAECPRLAGLPFPEARDLLFRCLDFNSPPREWKHRVLPLFFIDFVWNRVSFPFFRMAAAVCGNGFRSAAGDRTGDAL